MRDFEINKYEILKYVISPLYFSDENVIIILTF